MSDFIRKALVNIFRSKLRSFLTIAGISIGVLSVVVISSIGEVGTHTINSELGNMGIDSVMVSSGLDFGVMSADEVEAIRTVEGVQSAMPLMAELSQCRLIDTVTRCMVWGVDQNANRIISLESIHGRLVDRGDLLSNNNVCVIDESIAMEAYQRTNVIGKKINVYIGGGYKEFEIIGVVKSGVSTLQNLLSDIIPCFVYIPFTTMQGMTGRASFDQVAVKLSDNSGNSDTPELIKQTLSKLNGGTPINVNNLLKQKQQLNGILGIVSVVLSVIAGISLIVSGLSIMTVMLTSVSERTREIGIKKSIGATNKDIMLEFVLEAIMLTMIGSIIGISIGVGLSALGCIIMGTGVLLNFSLIAFTFIFSLVMGLMFGAYPAYKAAKLKPIDALRYE